MKIEKAQLNLVEPFCLKSFCAYGVLVIELVALVDPVAVIWCIGIEPVEMPKSPDGATITSVR
jgi:hypothetical protein